jgi:arginyl-tRNA synthetase
MIDYKAQIADLISRHLPGIPAEELAAALEIPTDERMGDYALPCFRLARTLRKAPPAIAGELAAKLAGEALFESVEAVNGYVNLRLARQDYARRVLAEILDKKDAYGRSRDGEGKRVIVEFSSPNIAKPFHIGHIRSTVIGNAIYKIYDFLGYETVRINHLGDYGTQFGKMICAYRRWGNKDDVIREPIKTLLGYYTKFHQEADQDPTLEQEARDIFTRLEQGAPEEVALWQWFRDESLKEFNRVYAMLGIEFDSYAGESFYSDKMPRMIRELEDKGLLQESRGARIVDLEPYGMSPALITKNDGSTLYITRDIAAAVYRKEHYDFYKNLYIVSSGQNLHFQQWIKIVELLGYEWAKDCVHIPFGLVSLEEGTMSTRAGRVVFLEDVLNRAIEKTRDVIIEKNVNTDSVEATAKQVGIGAVVFQELSNNRIKDYVFSWDRVLNFEGETGPYVQYTHARAASVLRKGGVAEGGSDGQDFDPAYLVSDRSYQLLRLLYAFPEVIREAGEKYEPSVVTRHIINLAQAFNKFYHDEHILTDDPAERKAKLALVAAVKTALKNGLGLLGIEAPEKM